MSIAALAGACPELTVTDLIKPGVYVLIRDGAVVYVGQSNNVLARVGMHCKSFAFDRVFYIPEPQKQERLAIEGALARRFNPPKSNVVSSRHQARDAEILARFGLELDATNAAAMRARVAACWPASTTIEAHSKAIWGRAHSEAREAGKSPEASRRTANAARLAYKKRRAAESDGAA